MGYSEKLGLDFYQEVYATRVAANAYLDNPDCIIELGGEDAKILFFHHLRQYMEILPLSLLQKNVPKDNVQIHMDGQSLCSNRYL